MLCRSAVSNPAALSPPPPPGTPAFCSPPKASAPEPGASARPGVASPQLRPFAVCTWPPVLASILPGVASPPPSPAAPAPFHARLACLLQGVRSGPGTADAGGHRARSADPNMGEGDRISFCTGHLYLQSHAPMWGALQVGKDGPRSHHRHRSPQTGKSFNRWVSSLYVILKFLFLNTHV